MMVAPESMINGRPKVIRLSKSAFRKQRFGSRGVFSAGLGPGASWLARFRSRWLPNINKNVLLPALISLRIVGLRIIDSNDHVILSACSTLWAVVSVAFQTVNVCMTIMGVVSNNFHGYLLDQVPTFRFLSASFADAANVRAERVGHLPLQSSKMHREQRSSHPPWWQKRW